MEKPLRYRKRLQKTGGSWYFVIPKDWLSKQAKRLKKRIIEQLDLLIYDDYIEIRAPKNQKMDAQKILNESQSSIKLTRTTRGYTWEIKIYHADADKIIPILREKDTLLRNEYIPELEPQ